VPVTDEQVYEARAYKGSTYTDFRFVNLSDSVVRVRIVQVPGNTCRVEFLMVLSFELSGFALLVMKKLGWVL